MSVVAGTGFGPQGPGRSERAAGIVLGAAMMVTGLIAGVFYAFAVSMMLGLRKTDDRTFVLAMQRMNEAIENPAFVPAFLGPFVLPALSARWHRRLGLADAARWIVAALILYALALVVSFGVNIPLNNKLARAGHPDHIANLAVLRQQFEGPWTAWNIVRAVLSTVALGCLGRALVLHGRVPASQRPESAVVEAAGGT